MQEKLYWLGFSLFPGIGPKKFRQLLEAFGSAENAWNASESSFEAIAKPALAQKFFVFKKNFSLDSYVKNLEAKNIWFVTLADNDYPELLRQSANPPFVLFGKGNPDLFLLQNTLGVVGTRKITTYGRQVTEMVTRELVEANFCIISGLAMGVDAIAHQTALENKGKTIAVLGCGVDLCFPKENEKIYERILSEGSLIVSEYPPGSQPTKGSFPSRNRIIAGLSKAIVVTEGAEDSGALITAEDCFVNKRSVFAIPGPITSSLSKGPNKLLKKGAVLVTSGDDILSSLGEASPMIKHTLFKSDVPDEQTIITLLAHEELTFDELVKRISFDPSRLNIILSVMEIKKILRKSDQGKYHLLGY
ncbi:MAG: DNA-protecting protein DprA [Candidatus Levybacteria bacterium]|nr:DNA-protecting protein DprA [Candidatus Levybacteria bacterium]